MDTKVYFEHLNEQDRVQGIAHLLLRRGRLTPHVLIFCPDTTLMHQLDDKLWTIHPESFLAHGIAGNDAKKNAAHPILLTLEPCHDNHPEVLFNAGLEVPPDLDGFSSVVDFVDAWSEPLLQASRERFRIYRKLGMNPQYLTQKKKG